MYNTNQPHHTRTLRAVPPRYLLLWHKVRPQKMALRPLNEPPLFAPKRRGGGGVDAAIMCLQYQRRTRGNNSCAAIRRECDCSFVYSKIAVLSTHVPQHFPPPPPTFFFASFPRVSFVRTFFTGFAFPSASFFFCLRERRACCVGGVRRARNATRRRSPKVVGGGLLRV